ncbi:MAG: prolyl oligopeptidase family serine peptidase [bacterium]|nr:prolyl oligopeptidase family serine peptidase [bacterium]
MTAARRPKQTAWVVLIGVLPLAGCHGARLEPKGEQMGQDVETGFVTRSIDYEGQSYRYAVYVPPGEPPASGWPAMLFLHGSGERGDDCVRQTMVGLPKTVRNHPERFPCIVVMPQCPLHRKWDPSLQGMALATLDAAEQEYRIDPDRIVLTGLSLGGYGTWAIGASHPQRFAALVPICGGGDPAKASSLARTPIWCFHGDADPVVPVEQSRKMVESVRAAGGDVRYSELPGVTHDSWTPAYEDPEAINWMLAQRR